MCSLSTSKSRYLGQTLIRVRTYFLRVLFSESRHSRNNRDETEKTDISSGRRPDFFVSSAATRKRHRGYLLSRSNRVGPPLARIARSGMGWMLRASPDRQNSRLRTGEDVQAAFRHGAANEPCETRVSLSLSHALFHAPGAARVSFPGLSFFPPTFSVLAIVIRQARRCARIEPSPASVRHTDLLQHELSECYRSTNRGVTISGLGQLD